MGQQRQRDEQSARGGEATEETLSGGGSGQYICGAKYWGDGGCWAPRWANIIRGGPYNMPASVNILTEAFTLEQLPR